MWRHRAKPWHRSRTIWLNIIVLIVCTAAENINRLDGLLGEHVFKVIAFVLPIASVLLRLMTTEGVHYGKRQEEEEA